MIIVHGVANSEQHRLEIEEQKRQQEGPRCPRCSDCEYDAQDKPGPHQQRQRLVELRQGLASRCVGVRGQDTGARYINECIGDVEASIRREESRTELLTRSSASRIGAGDADVGLTVLPVTNSMMPEMYWQTPPKNIMVVMMMLGASTPRVPIPVRETRKTLVAKERRPRGAGFARRR